ncbi:peptidyl-prolyl cis-trans isomerase, cyclophilin-type [Polaribacter irgensii 23-P]|uniref:Peptidyl-prolyl cis-trans isomerase n=1 Tax=Polaribacter irgensii 23-P TaxID=313594 RepID=A4C0Y4_9FLAO|nr:peptidylprolyl isomerase [Polaribacter irgensii]EAR13077.1 peptidyl-prolyl cis-trans isomerase, cyclophilin-type [Polaribacter irgensii 23-P]
MKIIPFLFLILFAFSSQQCSPKKQVKKIKVGSSKEKKSATLKKELQEVIETPWDSLTKKNVTAFFTEYGKQHKESMVVIKTDFGAIKIRLFADVPVHRANFLFLVQQTYFDTTVIYRVAKNFVIQGGNSDETYTREQRTLYGNYLLASEFKAHRKHKYGALAAARQWENNPDKLSSPFEFYLVHNRKGAHHLNDEHTVFGEVISGFDTMDKISEVKVGVDEWPVDDIKMTIEVLD